MNENYQTIRNNFIRNEELKRLEELKSKYANFQQPDYSTMSTRDALQTRFDLQKLNELQQKYGTQQMQTPMRTTASIPQSAYATPIRTTNYNANATSPSAQPNVGVWPRLLQTFTPISTVYAQEDQPKRKVYQSLTGFKPHQTEWYENNPQKDSIDFINDKPETSKLLNDCNKSDRFNTLIEKIYDNEGRSKHVSDQPTNWGLSKDTYKLIMDKKRKDYPGYPEKLFDATVPQVRNILCQEFYKPGRIEGINNDAFAEHVFDMMVNLGGTEAPKIIQNSINQSTGWGISNKGGIGTKTLSAINNLSPEQDYNTQTTMVKLRKDFYDKTPANRTAYPGLYTRADSFLPKKKF